MIFLKSLYHILFIENKLSYLKHVNVESTDIIFYKFVAYNNIR